MSDLIQTAFHSIVQSLVENDPDSFGIMSYSGRGMMGDQCFAVTCSSRSDDRRFMKEMQRSTLEWVLSSMASLQAKGEDITEICDELVDLQNDYRSDQLGYGTVLYWPIIEPVVEEDNEEE